jgi:hypothetical protein
MADKPSEQGGSGVRIIPLADKPEFSNCLLLDKNKFFFFLIEK